jgi:hypothetical protein
VGEMRVRPNISDADDTIGKQHMRPATAKPPSDYRLLHYSASEGAGLRRMSGAGALLGSSARTGRRFGRRALGLGCVGRSTRRWSSGCRSRGTGGQRAELLDLLRRLSAADWERSALGTGGGRTRSSPYGLCGASPRHCESIGLSRAEAISSLRPVGWRTMRGSMCGSS